MPALPSRPRMTPSSRAWRTLARSASSTVRADPRCQDPEARSSTARRRREKDIETMLPRRRLRRPASAQGDEGRPPSGSPPSRNELYREKAWSAAGADAADPRPVSSSTSHCQRILHRLFRGLPRLLGTALPRLALAACFGRQASPPWRRSWYEVLASAGFSPAASTKPTVGGTSALLPHRSMNARRDSARSSFRSATMRIPSLSGLPMTTPTVSGVSSDRPLKRSINTVPISVFNAFRFPLLHGGMCPCCFRHRPA